MKKFLAALMVVSLFTASATSAYARPNNNHHNNRRPGHSQPIRGHHGGGTKVVKIKKKSNPAPYIVAGLLGGALLMANMNNQSVATYSTYPTYVPTYVPTRTNSVNCRTIVSYDGRTTTETCTTSSYENDLYHPRLF